MKKTKTQKGITLIALIITIVVLLILAVVAINAVTGDGIIQHASNAKTEYEKAADDEEAMLQNYLVVLNKKTITWTKTSTGDLSVGSTVKTSTNEEFYVIGFKDNNEIAILLAKNNLKVDGSVQDSTGANNPCAFSTVENLNFTTGEDLNKNSTLKADTTSAVYKAIKYGEKLGVTTGRLMLKSEAEALQSLNSDILYGRNEKSSGEYLNYWLGSEHSTNRVWAVNGYGITLNDTSFGNVGGVRGASSC